MPKRSAGGTQGGRPTHGWGGQTGRYPSGRPSKGGANRSSNIKREINRTTMTVERCPTCRGLTAYYASLTALWPSCSCTTSQTEVAVPDQTTPPDS